MTRNAFQSLRVKQLATYHLDVASQNQIPPRIKPTSAGFETQPTKQMCVFPSTVPSTKPPAVFGGAKIRTHQLLRCAFLKGLGSNTTNAALGHNIGVQVPEEPRCLETRSSNEVNSRQPRIIFSRIIDSKKDNKNPISMDIRLMQMNPDSIRVLIHPPRRK